MMIIVDKLIWYFFTHNIAFFESGSFGNLAYIVYIRMYNRVYRDFDTYQIEFQVLISSRMFRVKYIFVMRTIGFLVKRDYLCLFTWYHTTLFLIFTTYMLYLFEHCLDVLCNLHFDSPIVHVLYSPDMLLTVNISLFIYVHIFLFRCPQHIWDTMFNNKIQIYKSCITNAAIYIKFA